MEKEDKAVVIGGGIAGLLASRVLSEHFAQVVIIEKDHYPEDIVQFTFLTLLQPFRSSMDAMYMFPYG
jgi:flavin-dependent dehydrogenase